MNGPGARAALATYVAACGPAETDEPEAWQASGLMTDVLLLFAPDDAEQILHRVERDYSAEQPDTTPVSPAAD
ncbi:hypothetical protein PUR49_08140 [Streptomyces sp. BE147]|uniref:hypothetical protein n=1 Tax=Streptomyces sp. BE147 TaxID=3002524 RepID=UPI002E788BC5|nr:hypothetical protein [Streptomyces sp. BE147]MEE1736468.1 hypothetical protein [Streptomyces sp. BE147]